MFKLVTQDCRKKAVKWSRVTAFKKSIIRCTRNIFRIQTENKTRSIVIIGSRLIQHQLKLQVHVPSSQRKWKWCIENILLISVALPVVWLFEWPFHCHFSESSFVFRTCVSVLSRSVVKIRCDYQFHFYQYLNFSSYLSLVSLSRVLDEEVKKEKYAKYLKYSTLNRERKIAEPFIFKAHL